MNPTSRDISTTVNMAVKEFNKCSNCVIEGFAALRFGSHAGAPFLDRTGRPRQLLDVRFPPKTIEVLSLQQNVTKSQKRKSPTPSIGS